MKIKEPYDWKEITPKQIIRSGGSYLLKIHGSIFDMLKAIFPGLKET